MNALRRAGRFLGSVLPVLLLLGSVAALLPVLLGMRAYAITSGSMVPTIPVGALVYDKEIPTESILAVTAEGGQTQVGPIDEASRSVLREHLFTAGELLRVNQFAPDGGAAAGSSSGGGRLFDLEGSR